MRRARFQKRWHLKPFLLTLGVIILLAILHYLSVLRPLESLLTRAFQPIQRAVFVTAQDLSYRFGNLGRLAELEADSRRFQEKTPRLSGQITKLIGIAEDNVILREQLKLQKSRERQLVFAKLLGYYDLKKDGKILLNIGRADNLEKEMPVILYDSLAGVITAVGEYSSTATLISSPNLTLNVYVQGKPNAKGLLKGQAGSSALLLSHIDKNIKLEVGEFVLTTGQGVRDNRNLLLGTIIEQIDNDKDPYNSYLVSPALALEKLGTVFVVTASS